MLYAAVAVVLLALAVVTVRRFPRRLRGFSWADDSRYVRFYPNPGFRLGRVRWSRSRGLRITGKAS